MCNTHNPQQSLFCRLCSGEAVGDNGRSCLTLLRLLSLYLNRSSMNLWTSLGQMPWAFLRFAIAMGMVLCRWYLQWIANQISRTIVVCNVTTDGEREDNSLLQIFKLVLSDDVGTRMGAEHFLEYIHHGRRTCPSGCHLVGHLRIADTYTDRRTHLTII